MLLTLHRNIQFIYELVLAQMELDSFDISYQIDSNLRRFRAVKGFDVNHLAKCCAYFKEIDDILSNYHFIQQYNQTRSINQYLTHWFYPYKGKFHPQMVRALCNIIGLKEGDLLLDPFVGSGTAALEAQLLDIDFIGTDISPLCVLQSRVKAESLSVLDEIVELRGKIQPLGRGVKRDDPRTGLLFKPMTYEDIQNSKVRNFYTLAEMIAHSDSERRRRDFAQSFKANVDKMIASVEDYKKVVDKLGLTLGEVTIRQTDSRNLDLKDESVDGIITSPPYSIALNYVENDAHALEALGYDLSKIKDDFVGVRGRGPERFRLYYQDMECCYKEMYRVLRPGRYCVIVIGNVTYQGKEEKTSKWTEDRCKKIGFKLVKEVDKIVFGLYNVMQQEFIQIYKKE
jgi:tRNA G10  N-methylase Trm11